MFACLCVSLLVQLLVCLFACQFVATFRVARLTLQARKLWLVGVATDRDARYLGPARMLRT